MSETAKHTRAPWRSQGWVPTWAYIPIHDASHNLIASMYPDSGHRYTREEVEANARLVAAAPDLLDGCNALLGLIQLVCDRDDMPAAIREALTTSHRVDEARAALAKTGATP